MRSGITLINNEIKKFIKVFRSLENRETLLKRTTKKLLFKREDYSLIFLVH